MMLQPPPDPDLVMMIPVFKLFIIAISGTIVALPLVRALVRRLDRAPQHQPLARDSDARLARIEQAVDAIAIEVERVSEAQRFTTRLLSERVPGSSPPTERSR